MPKIERNSPSATTNPKAQALARPTSTPELPAAPRAQPSTAYTGQAAPKKELVPKQQQLTASADPTALWGDAPSAAPLDAEALAKLSPAEQQQAIESLSAELDQLGRDISQRIEQLDVRWNRSRLSTRTEALREYEEHSRHLHPGRRRQLDGLLDRSEAAQRRINELRARIDRLPKTPAAKAEMKALRSALAKELVALRAEQSKAVKEATAVVDAAGLKVDRLAVTEQLIDPGSPGPGSGGSLLEKLARFLELDALFTRVQLQTARAQQAAFSQDIDRRAEAREQEFKARLDRERADAAQQEQRRQQQVRTEAPEVAQVRELLAALTPPRTAAARPA
jgi:hypothetical protein